MKKPVRALGDATRQANKKLRRERIFTIAKRQIATKGLEEFTISELAEEAGVSTPTIHNLFGKKDDITQELIEKLVLALQNIMSKPVFDDPIESAVFYVDSILEMYEGKEDFYRSAYMACEKAGMFEDRESVDSFYQQSLNLAELCCKGALKHGFLLGNIDTTVLTRELYDCHRSGRQDWVIGYINLNEYRDQVLESMLMIYAADASPECHKRIISEINRVNSH